MPPHFVGLRREKSRIRRSAAAKLFEKPTGAMPECLIGLGSNLGDPRDNFARAIDQLQSSAGIALSGVSSWYRSTAVGGTAGQPPFLNGTVLISTPQTARELLQRLHQVEASLGRERKLRWEPRRIDLDLLLYGDHVLIESSLRVPHPWMAFRPFVLRPAAEIAPLMRHPEIGWTMSQLWDHAKTYPKILALAPCSQVWFDCLCDQLSHLPDLFPIRFPDFDRDTLSGLGEPEAIEFMSRRVAWFHEQLPKYPETATVVVGGWWDQPLGWMEQASEHDQCLLRDSSVYLQSQLNPVIPHVTLGFAGGAEVVSGQEPAIDSVYAYMRRPEGGPFLILTTGDLPQSMHDVLAIVRGFHSLIEEDRHECPPSS